MIVIFACYAIQNQNISSEEIIRNVRRYRMSISTVRAIFCAKDKNLSSKYSEVLSIIKKYHINYCLLNADFDLILVICNIFPTSIDY